MRLHQCLKNNAFSPKDMLEYLLLHASSHAVRLLSIYE